MGNSNNLYVTLPLVWAVLFIWFFTLRVNRVFFPMHKLRIERIPRRYIHYSPLMVRTNRLIGWSLLVTISSAIIMLWSLKSNLSNLVSTIRLLPVDQIFRLPTKIHSWEERPYSRT